VVEKLSGLIRAHCVAAFKINEDSEPALAVVAEVKNPKALPDPLTIAVAVRNFLNVEVALIAFIAPRVIPRTSSGKIMRHKAKRMWLNDEFTVLTEFSREKDAGAAASCAEYQSSFDALKARYNLTGAESYNLIEAGLDSMDLVVFMHEIKEVLKDKGAEMLARQVDISLIQRVSVAELFQLAGQLETAPEEALTLLRHSLAVFREEQRAAERRMMGQDRKLIFEPSAPALLPGAPELNQVLLTGGTGFIGGHIVKQLLESDEYEVSTTVRNEAKALFLKTVHATKQPRFVKADLENSEDEWVSAMEGMDVIVHCASFVPNKEPADPEREVVQYNVQSCLRVLAAAARVPSIKRIVLTSSVAAIHEGYAHHASTPEKRMDETWWTQLEGPHKTYSYARSKTLQERAAWDFVKEKKPQYDLVAICPVVVFGPVLDKVINTSLEYITALLTRRVPAIPDVWINIVDVRDVALAHVTAIKSPEASGKRFITVGNDGEPVSYAQLAAWVKEECAPLGYSIPTYRMPNALLHVVGWFDKAVGTYIVPTLGNTIWYNSSASKEGLHLTYRPTRESVVDTCRDLHTLGLVKP